MSDANGRASTGDDAIDFVLHELDTRDGLLACFTFALHEPAVAVTVRRALTDGADPPWALARALLAPARHAHAQGLAVAPGSVLSLAPRELGLDDAERAALAGLGLAVSAVGLLPAPHLAAERDGAAPPLCVLALTDEEASIARRFGLTRVAARLGEATGYFPFAPWLDRARGPLARGNEASRTALLRASALPLAAPAAVYVADDRVALRLAPGQGRAVARALDARGPESEAFALLCTPPDDADGLLVWQPGQDDARGIAPADGEGARVAGNALVLALGAAALGANLLEDGFALHLPDEALERFSSALASSAPFALEPSPSAGLGFRLEWLASPRNN